MTQLSCCVLIVTNRYVSYSVLKPDWDGFLEKNKKESYECGKARFKSRAGHTSD